MSQTALYSKAFVTTIEDLQQFLLTKCPQFSEEIKLSQLYVITLKKISISHLISQLFVNLKPYKQQIMNCDEHFFLDHHNLPELTDPDRELWNTLADCWKSDNVTEKDQAKIWYYVQRMVKLAELLGF